MNVLLLRRWLSFAFSSSRCLLHTFEGQFTSMFYSAKMRTGEPE
eukprot:COSAG06_NODE_2658_length_6481_cov_157.286901_1_plen_44_part_00